MSWFRFQSLVGGWLTVIFLSLVSCGSMGTYYPNTNPSKPTINPPTTNSIGISSSHLQSGGMTQSQHFVMHAYNSPFLGNTLSSQHYQINDVSIQNDSATTGVQP